MLEDLLLLFLAIGGLMAGIIRGVAGFGGPMILIPLMNMIYAPVVTVPVVLLVDTLAGAQLVPEAWRKSRASVVTCLVVGTVAALPAGAAILILAEPTILKRAISGAILILALITFFGYQYARPLSGPGYVLVGALGGGLMGATGIAATVPLFLSAGHDTAAENRFHFIVWVFVASTLIGLVLLAAGQISLALLPPFLALLPTYGLGVYIGRRLSFHVSDANLRRLVIGLVILVACVGLVG